jgi:osmotically inducible protein OsmC
MLTVKNAAIDSMTTAAIAPMFRNHTIFALMPAVPRKAFSQEAEDRKGLFASKSHSSCYGICGGPDTTGIVGRQKGGDAHDPQSESPLARHRPRWRRQPHDRFRRARCDALFVQTRFENEKGTNPEELIAAAHAACFTMALAFQLTGAGKPPESLETSAVVSIEQVEGGFKISSSALTLKAKVPDLSKDEFMKLAETAKANCPVSKVLNAAISLNATLE